jgi:hypothetical protein
MHCVPARAGGMPESALHTNNMRGTPVDLKVPIKISDEVGDEVVEATGLLDLASGEIHRIEYQDYDLEGRGLPADSEDYEFTVGTLSNNGKDVEFKVDVNRVTGQYSVSPSELLEIKVRAAQLFAGISGRDMARGADPKGGGAAKGGRGRGPLH